MQQELMGFGLTPILRRNRRLRRGPKVTAFIVRFPDLSGVVSVSKLFSLKIKGKSQTRRINESAFKQ